MTPETVHPKNLTQDLGGKWYRHYGVAPCPVCQPDRKRTQNALTVNVKSNRLLLHCKKSGCDFRDILCAAGLVSGQFEIDRHAIEQADREQLAQAMEARKRARSIWATGNDVKDTEGEAYLRKRGITCALPNSLRWAQGLYHGPSATTCNAILADVTTGGLHRTFFDLHGQRLNKSAKMMLGPCTGGAVRLSDAQGPLVVCEGLETGLSLLSGLLEGPHAVWAALSTSGITGLALPTNPHNLIIASDGDSAGQEAAYKLASRASSLGWAVAMLPAPDGQDWNDVLHSEVPA